jgi:hypothetical protein
MKMTGGSQRHEVPLANDLHEIGLKYGVEMVVVAIPMRKDDPEGVRPLLIDHKENTPMSDLVPRFTGAGVFLIKCAAAAEEYLAEQTEKDGGR